MLKKTIVLALFAMLTVGCNAQKESVSKTEAVENGRDDAVVEDGIKETLEDDINDQSFVEVYHHAKKIPSDEAIQFVTTCPYEQCVRAADRLDDTSIKVMNSLALPTIQSQVLVQENAKRSRGYDRLRVAMLEPKVTGAIEKRVIEKVTRQHLGPIRACYKNEFVNAENSNDHIVVDWLISPQGIVQNTNIAESSIKNDKVENCVMNEIKTWRYPDSKDGAAVKVSGQFLFGYNLILSRYNVYAKINGNYASVKTEFTITNNQGGWNYEGKLEFLLPENAVITNYAMDIGLTMQEAHAVKKETANDDLERELANAANISLVEQTGDNSYSIRISPISSYGERHIRIEYTTPLTVTESGEALLVLPMPKDKLDPERKADPRGVTIKKMLNYNSNVIYREEKILEVPKDNAPAFSLKLEAQNTTFPLVTGLKELAFKAIHSDYTLETHDVEALSTGNVLISIPKMPSVVTAIEKNQDEYFFSLDMDCDKLDSAKELQPERYVKSLSGIGISMVQGIGQRASGHISLIGRMEQPTDRAVLTLSDGSRYQIDFDTKKLYEGQILSSQWAKRRVNALSALSQNQDELADISHRFNIVTPFTSLMTREDPTHCIQIGPHCRDTTPTDAF